MVAVVILYLLFGAAFASSGYIETCSSHKWDTIDWVASILLWPVWLVVFLVGLVRGEW